MKERGKTELQTGCVLSVVPHKTTPRFYSILLKSFAQYEFNLRKAKMYGKIICTL
jgi:hypothetical protein